MKQKNLIAKLDQDAIIRAIENAERACSGEIRVHVQRSIHGKDIRHIAEKTFERLGMTKTELRNGVLIFISSEEQQFVVLGDSGIHEQVGDVFWRDVSQHLTERFREGDFTGGIIHAIEEVGSSLAHFFPRSGDDVNELPDEISVDDSHDAG
ncbi:MAG TPA: TPM domain-containing protein [Thermoanaerobaculia bacterium]|nr:TPM domain-containing protein [Thermoanaerobaculia bacterium]